MLIDFLSSEQAYFYPREARTSIRMNREKKGETCLHFSFSILHHHDSACPAVMKAHLPRPQIQGISSA